MTPPNNPTPLQRLMERWEYIQSVERNVAAYNGNEAAGYAEIARLKSKFADEAAAFLNALPDEEMVERVARAMAQADTLETRFSSASPLPDYRVLARAAISTLYKGVGGD
jgi:hypothetical protein